MDPTFSRLDPIMWMPLLLLALSNSTMPVDFPTLSLSDMTTSSFDPLNCAHIYLSLMILLATRKTIYPPRVFWVEPRQETFWKYVQPTVWGGYDEMEDKRYMELYRMNRRTFDELVGILTPYLQSHIIDPIRPQLEIRKIVAVVRYRFAHAAKPDQMAHLFQVGGSTIRKYVDIVSNILCDKNKLFGMCISIPTGERLQDIIDAFQSITKLPNICGAIDGTHIPLKTRPDRRDTIVSSDFYNRKKFNSIVLQAVCDANRIFWNVCASQPGGVHDRRQFQLSSLYKALRSRTILQTPVLDVGGMLCTPFLIGDSAYPIRTYLQKNWKSSEHEDKKRYDSAMNSRRVVIENAFGSLKNRWQILQNFNSNVDRAALVTVACCWLHNFCQERNLPEPGGSGGRFRDDLRGFGNVRLPVYRETQRAKSEGEALRQKLFEQWVLQNPN